LCDGTFNVQFKGKQDDIAAFIAYGCQQFGGKFTASIIDTAVWWQLCQWCH
jgi:hypothetical protein